MTEPDELFQLLEGLHASAEPGASARARIVSELRRRGTLRRPHRWQVITAAAALLAGLSFALLRVTALVSSSSGQRYVLIFDTVTADYSNMDSEEAAALAVRYQAWVDDLEKSGRLKESYYLRSARSTEGLEAVSGIVVIEAGSEEEARRIASSSPHLRRGGTISIRELASPR